MAGVDHEYQLVEGLNDVPGEVADHWYVKKFMRPVRRVPRVVLPSAARPLPIPPATIASMADAIAPLAAAPEAPDPLQTADVPAAGKVDKAKA